MIHVGTSGYAYPHWRGLLYPHDLAVAHWLERYAAFFSTVELNATFYRLPTAAAVDRWRDETPPRFVFACKGSRYLTHMKRLRDGEGLERFFSVVLRFGKKLGPVLFQLPPQMTRPEPERLAQFLDRLPPGVRAVFEFRSAGWYTDEVCDVLDAHGAAFCEHDLVSARPPRATGGFRYVRLHGASAKYHGRYGASGLRALAADLARWSARRKTAWVYFNNDAYGHALFDAATLGTLLDLPFARPLEAALPSSGSARHPA